MDVEIRQSKIHGLGLFAVRTFQPGDLITKTPVVLLPKSEIYFSPTLSPYTFDFGGSWMLGLGSASFVNHGENPNAEIIYHVPTHELWLTAAKTIDINDEVCIFYKNMQTRG